MDSCTIDVGVRIGLRSNSEALSDLLRHAFGAYVVDDPAAPRNFTVAMRTDPSTPHRLYWGGCIAVSSFDPERILAALVRHIAIHAPLGPGLVQVRSLALEADHGAVLVPAPLADDLRERDRKLRSLGFAPFDMPGSILDLASAELVIPTLDRLDADALAEAGSRGARRRRESSAATGRHRLDRWLFIDYAGGSGALSRASATRAAANQITAGVDRLSEPLLRQLSTVFDSTRGFAMELGYPGAILRSITRLGAN